VKFSAILFRLNVVRSGVLGAFDVESTEPLIQAAFNEVGNVKIEHGVLASALAFILSVMAPWAGAGRRENRAGETVMSVCGCRRCRRALGKSFRRESMSIRFAPVR
jgi:hypothetical protein